MNQETLVTIFYSLGIVYFTLCFIFLIGLMIALIVAYRKAVQFQKKAAAAIAHEKNKLNSVPKLGKLIVMTLVNRFINSKKR